eukprot:10222642-Alexandrium_andersonii.AAC.1
MYSPRLWFQWSEEEHRPPPLRGPCQPPPAPSAPHRGGPPGARHAHPPGPRQAARVASAAAGGQGQGRRPGGRSCASPQRLRPLPSRGPSAGRGLEGRPPA